MGFVRCLSLIPLLIGLHPSCSRQPAQPPPGTWTHGFWFWQGSSERVRAESGPVDVLYIHGGSIQRGRMWSSQNFETRVYGGVPDSIPPAREYWIVFREETPGPPERSVAPRLVKVAEQELAEMSRRGYKVAGVQLDIDCPTGSLGKYAEFLRAVRKQLPPGTQLSITALLDWFRPGTDIEAVVREVEEFVPQFYDTGDPREGRVATRIDGGRWAPRFGLYRKRFRIGVSTFGRALFRRREGVHEVADAKPSDIAGKPGFRLEVASAPSGEKKLIYRAESEQTAGYRTVGPGESYEFTLATIESVRTAVEQAKAMGQYCAGVVFFRWPAADESMAMLPDETLSAAGAIPAHGGKPWLKALTGTCAAVDCADVYAFGLPRMRPEATRYRIVSTEPLEYFIPAESVYGQSVPVRMTGAAELELTLPPFASQSRILLGRAVTRKPARLSIEELP